jgi:hypothetical protein
MPASGPASITAAGAAGDGPASDRDGGAGMGVTASTPRARAGGAGAVLLTLATGQILMTLDSSVTNVAIATMAADVGTTRHPGGRVQRRKVVDTAPLTGEGHVRRRLADREPLDGSVTLVATHRPANGLAGCPV